MKKIGYARVSTKDQNLEMQIEAMKHAGCDKIYMEKKSGRKLKNRPVLRRLLKQSTAGDILIVWKIDRLGRSARELLEVLDIVRTRVRDKDCVKNRVKRAKIVRFTLC